MITAIFVFLATAMALVIYVIYAFRWFALFLLLILGLIIYIKVRREISKYGIKSIFRAFHEYPTDNEQLKLVKNILKNKTKMDYVFELDSELLIGLSKSGIYVIKVLDAVGRIAGNLDAPTLLLKNKEVTTIPNMFQELETLEKNIKKEIPNFLKKKVIVKKGTCLFELPYSKEYIVMGMHNFYYRLQVLEKEIRYTKEQVNEVKIILENYLSKNVKLEENSCTKTETKLQSK